MSEPNGARAPVTDEVDGEYGVHVIDLTDEELQAVNPLTPSERLVLYPFLDQLEDDARDLATVVAFRGLAARGLVIPITQVQVEEAMAAGGETAAVELHLDEAIANLVQTRMVAPKIVCAQRTVAERPDYCYWYVADDESTLEEFVETKGLHRFRVIETRLVPLALYGYLNPERVAGRDGETFRESADAAAEGRTPAVELERLGGTHCIGEFFVRDAGQPPKHPLLVGVASGPNGLQMTESRFGSGEPLRIREVSGATVYERIEQVVASEAAGN